MDNIDDRTAINFKNCPFGKINEERISHATELFSKEMASLMENLQLKIDNINTKIDTRFDIVDNKIDNLDDKVKLVDVKVKSLDDKVKALDEKLNGVDDITTYIDKEVDAKIDISQKDKVFGFFKWVIIVLLGGTTVTVCGKLVLKLLNL